MDTLQVVAEPRRRQILGLVWDREMAASDIADQFEVTFGAVSQHLAVLRDAGLVTVRKDGNRRMYKADQDALGPYSEILKAMWSDTLQQLAEAIEGEESNE